MESKMVLEQLFEDAKRNLELRKKLIETQNEKDPLESFCEISCSYGHNISVGELFAIGEEDSDNQCKSTNGGNPYPYDSFDDAYTNFIERLK